MANSHNTLHALLRNDFHAFTKKAFETVNPDKQLDANWHIILICWLLTRAARLELTRLALCLCPRSLKSFIASVAFPAWRLGNDPTMRFICISYSDDLAAKHSRDFQIIVRASWYRKAFPKLRFDNTKFTEREFVTTKNGFRYTTSVHGTLTGRGGNFIIIDDPIKAEDAMSDAERTRVNNWFSTSVLSRFDNPNEGVLIIVGQRTHVDDLIGRVTATGDWHSVSVPAIATKDEKIQIGDNDWFTRKTGDPLHASRIDFERLEFLRREMGSYNFEAQYQQNPIPAEGNLIKKDWIRTYSSDQIRFECDSIVQSWDTASSPGGQNDYSVCTTWAIKEKRYFLLHVFRERLDFPSLLTKTRTHARNSGASVVLIEDAASGKQLLQTLRANSNVPVKSMKPDKDKLTRVAAVSSFIEFGRVYLPEDAPWLGTFLNELLAFPNSKYDDQVDSFSQFLRWAMNVEYFKPPVITVTALGGSRVRDRYYERTGVSTFPRHLW